MDMAQSLEEALHRSTKVADDIPTLPALCRTRPKEEWSDELLTQLVRDLHFPSTAYLRAEKPRILKRFFGFYIVGVVDKLDTTVGIINDVIAIASTPMGTIWKPSDKEVEGFYPNNTSDPPSLATLQTGALHALTFPNPNWNYGKNSLIQFQNYLHDVIEGIDPESPETAPEKSVIQLATFLALTLYRFATKNATLMENTFWTDQYRNKLTKLAGWPAEHPFSPPCKRCLKICKVALAKGQISTSKLFTKVVHEFVLTQKGIYRDPYVAGILSAALLAHTAQDGLGMIRMLSQVQEITQIRWKDIRHKTFNTLTLASWKNLVKCFAEQCTIGSLQYSFHWARIIDHGYFGELASAKNVFLATVFGSIIAKEQGNGVWKAVWAKRAAIPEDAKYLGQAIYEINLKSYKDDIKLLQKELMQ